MKVRRSQAFTTGLLVLTLVVLSLTYFVPRNVSAAKAAFCGYQSCIIMCEGDDCHCGHVGSDSVECWCNNPGGTGEYQFKICS